MPGISRAHFILYVHSQEASRAFYESVLGCRPTLDAPGMTEFTLPGGAVLGLMPETGITRLLGLDPHSISPGSIRGEIYLVVSAPEVFHRRALAAGAGELSPLARRDWGDRAAYSLDPDGYILAFAAPLGPG